MNAFSALDMAVPPHGGTGGAVHCRGYCSLNAVKTPQGAWNVLIFRYGTALQQENIPMSNLENILVIGCGGWVKIINK